MFPSSLPKCFELHLLWHYNATSFSFVFVKSLHVTFRADFIIPFILAPYNVGRGRLVLHPKFGPENGSKILLSRIKLV